MSKKTTRKDAGERIAERCIKMARAGAWVTGQTNLAKDIRRAINRAVRQERERCLAIVESREPQDWKGKQFRDFVRDVAAEIRNAKGSK